MRLIVAITLLVWFLTVGDTIIVISIEKLELDTANRRERQRSARGRETKVVC